LSTAILPADFDIDGGLEEREGKRDVQRLFRERRGLDDAILDVDPGSSS